MLKYWHFLVVLAILAGGASVCRATSTPSPVPTATSTPTVPPTNTPTVPPTNTPTVTSTPTPEPTIDPATAMALAMAGVTGNYQWRPYVEEIGGVEMALVPAGCFMMGSTEDQIDYAVQLCEEGQEKGVCQDRFNDERPVHEVCFEIPFWIDVYEVTNAQYGEAASDCTRYSSDDDQPRVCIDWFDSAAHCESRGARLPTEAEWEYTARGPDGLVYPWGNEFIADNVVYVSNSGSRAWEVGSKPGGVSWVGAYDLSGNVWEWVNDWYGAYPVEAQVNPAGPGGGEFRVLRGGSWYSGTDSLGGANRIRPMYDPSMESSSFGFRCALSYSP